MSKIFQGKDAYKLSTAIENIDETTGAIPVSIASASSTEYVDGASATGAAGKVAMGLDSTNHLQFISVESDGTQNIEVIEAVGVYSEGETVATPDGMVMLGKGPADVVYALDVDASGNLNVNCVTGGLGGTQYQTGDSAAGAYGYLSQGVDGTTIRNVNVDSSGHLQVDVLSGGGSSAQYVEGTTQVTPTGNAMLMQRADSRVYVPALNNSNQQEVILKGDDTLVTDAASVSGEQGRLMMGEDPSNNAQVISTNIDGEVDVNVGNTVAVSGTITANAGTNLNTSALATETGNIADIESLLDAAIGTEGSSLSSGILLQGDDGSNRHNVAVTNSGHVEVEVQETVYPDNGTVTLLSSGAYTSSFTTAAVDVRHYRGVFLVCDVTAAAGVMRLEVQTSHNGTVWHHRQTINDEINASNNTLGGGDATRGQLDSVDSHTCYIPEGIGNYLRLNATLSGSPDFTFSVIGSGW